MNSSNLNAENFSPSPWAYEFSPYTVSVAAHDDSNEVGNDIPAFVICDAEGNKIFDTNEDSPQELQEANARLVVAAPDLLQSLIDCANLLADYDESESEEGRIYRRAITFIGQAIGLPADHRILPPITSENQD